jgi:hypothetical protein
MSEGVTVIYQAQHMPEAQLLQNALEAEGIDAVVAQTASPFDGVIAANQGTGVTVKDEDVDRARLIVAEFVTRSAGDPDN